MLPIVFVFVVHFLLCLDLLLCYLKPSLERNLEVHDSEEWINAVLLLDYSIENFIIADLCTLPLGSYSLHVDRKLCSELKDLHFLIDLHVSILSSHAPVEHLVEENVTIVTFDTHFKKLFFELTIVILFIAEPKCFVNLAQLSEEVSQTFFLDLETLIFILSQLFPYFHEADRIIFKPSKHIVIWEIVLFKLLNNNQNEKIEHHMRTNKDKEDEVYETKAGTTVDAFNTSPFFCARTIKHYFVPIFAC